MKQLAVVLDAILRADGSRGESDPDPEWRRYLSARQEPRPRMPQGLNDELTRERSFQKNYFNLISRIPASPCQAGAAKEHGAAHRALRKKQWLAEAQSWSAFQKTLDGIFDGLVTTRHNVAKARGYETYAAWLHKKRPAGVPASFALLLSEPCRSLLSAVHRQYKEELHLKRLRPYDLNFYDLRRVDGIEELTVKSERVLRSVHPLFSGLFKRILRDGTYDWLPTPGKSPESFCLQLSHSKKPFVYLFFKGSRRDVMTGLHELGHAMHIALSFGKRNRFYDYHVDPAASEFFALVFELLCLEHLSFFYPEKLDCRFAIRKHFESIINVFTSYITVSEYEDAVYTTRLTPAKRRKLFASLASANIGSLDYTGHKRILELWAYRIPLLVSSPGYFCNYAYSQLGALSYYKGLKDGLHTMEDFINLMHEYGTDRIDDVYKKFNFTVNEQSIADATNVLKNSFKNTSWL